MRKLQLIIVAVLAALGTIEASVTPAGKCNTENIVPVPLPLRKMEKHIKWKILYATDFGPYSHVDHEFYLVTPLGGDNYKLSNKKVLKDKSELKYSLGLRYIDNVLIEDDEDENGKRQRFYIYILALTSEFAGLAYRCSDAGNVQADYRLIAAPEGVTLSEEGLKQLLAVDEKIFGNRRGKLIKLPDEIRE